jgi:hypothetical protein
MAGNKNILQKKINFYYIDINSINIIIVLSQFRGVISHFFLGCKTNIENLK